jgi:antitoxin (DNA-binding transcriptional repressor) of toxin-antitoxin stability system
VCLAARAYAERATSFGQLDAPPRRTRVRPAVGEGPREDILLLILAVAVGLLAAVVALERYMGLGDLPRGWRGEGVVIARGAKPVVRLVPVDAPKPRRVAGTLTGQIEVPDSFFDPLPEEELRPWEGG